MPTTPPKVLPAGTLLGRFRIEALAGMGGMGEVYRAFDATLERSVALKRLRLDAADPRAVARFRREATSLAQLNHPAICQVYDLTETERGIFIAMEWVEGRTLSQMLGDPRAPLPPAQARGILQAVAEALAAAHAKGIVHRDLKPGNVMVTPEGGVKVLDFGLAKGSADAELPPPSGPIPVPFPGEEPTLDRPHRPSGANEALTEAGIFMGTMGYASPEQIRGKWVTSASDAFSLGILAHELLTGLKPFDGDGDQLLRAVVKNQRVALTKRPGPRRLWSLIDQLLQTDPKARPTAAEAAEELAEMARPLSPAWWAGLSAAGVLLLTFGAYWLFGRGVLAGLVKGRPARVAVLGFRNDTGNPLFDAQTELGLADLLADALRSSPKLQVMDSAAIAQAAQILKLNPAKAGPEDQLRLAKALGADLILTGRVERKDGEDVLHFMLRDRNRRIRTQGESTQARVSDLVLNGPGLATLAAALMVKAVAPLGAEHIQAGLAPIQPETFATYARGLDAFRHGHYAEADPLLQQAAYANPEWASAVQTYASNMVNQRSPRAEIALRWALVASRAGHDHFVEESVLQYLGKWALGSKDFQGAEVYFGQALELARMNHDPEGIAFSLNGKGQIAQAKGDLESASAQYQSALDTARSSGGTIMQIQAETNLGNLALNRGDLNGAEKHYRAVVEQAHSIDYETGEALGLNNLGIVLLSSFNTGSARQALEHALALREKNGERLWLVSGHRNLGICAQMEGLLERARAEYESSMEIARSIQDPYGVAKARFYIAELDRREGRLESAKVIYQEVAHTLEGAHEAVRLGQSLAGLSECIVRIGQSKGEPPSLLRASELIPDNPYLLRARAWFALSKGNKEESLHLLDEAIKDPKHDGPEIRSELLELIKHFQSR